ncbi:MAG: ABC transporter ATP-binding protein, partial [Oscillospiraceae bacterium]|nr:ABC transporter ATP-binding protein [Oscillospiraceae bacterium]
MSQEQKPRRRGPMMGPPGMMPGEKAKDFKGTLRRLVKELGGYRIGVLFVMLFAVGSTVFNILGPKILGNATSELFAGFVAKIGNTGGIDFGRIGQILMTLMAMYAVSACFAFAQGWIMSGISQRISFRFRKELTDKIHRMPMAYFESHPIGEVLSRVTNDVDTLGMSLNQSIVTLISSITTLIGVLIMMLSISPLMTLIALVMLPISGGLVGFVVKRSQKYFKTQQEYLGKINGQVEEVYGGHAVVKAFGREEAALDEFMATNRVLYRSAWKSQFLSGMMHPVMQFVG